MEKITFPDFSTIKETQGVAVATFGNSTDFPAFFTPTSGFKVLYG